MWDNSITYSYQCNKLHVRGNEGVFVPIRDITRPLTMFGKFDIVDYDSV